MRRSNYVITLVCEGYGDRLFAIHIRNLYLPRNCGTALQISNARGFGGRHALSLALEQQARSGYDAYAVMIDTDRHWTDAERTRAQEAGITAIESDPCLEAILLRIDQCAVAKKTADNKRVFESRFGGPAHREGVIRRHFDRAKIDAARSSVESLDTLLRLLRCP